MSTALKPRDVASDEEGETEDEEEFHSGEDEEGSVVSTDGEDDESEDVEAMDSPQEADASARTPGEAGSAAKADVVNANDVDAEENEREIADSDNDDGDDEEEADNGEDEPVKQQTAKKPLEPYDVPKAGAFFMHDDRGGGTQRTAPRKGKGGKIWEEESGGKWVHDRFDNMGIDSDDGDSHYSQGGKGRGRGRGKGRGRGRGRGRGGRGAGYNDGDNEFHSHDIEGEGGRGRGRGRDRGQGKASGKVLVVARPGDATQQSGSDPDDAPPGFEANAKGQGQGQGRHNGRQQSRTRKGQAHASNGDRSSGLNAQAADYNPAAKGAASVLQTPQAAYAQPFIPAGVYDAAAHTAGFTPDAAAFYPAQMAMPHMMYPGEAGLQGYVPATMPFMSMHMGMAQADVDASAVPYIPQYSNAAAMSQAMVMAMTPEQMASMMPMAMMDPAMLQGMHHAAGDTGQNSTKTRSSHRYSAISGNT